ncbi:hypothetical protein J2W54_004969 [Rhodococcus fascians]|uniref:GAF domain-containing protein n=1 Tax=Nocardiaceae TaxID=85025 RepID=UPI00285F8250|nr:MULTISPECIES: GAF domain-containing protein [Rhodococcus]MDR6912956.1 hypothetical protein [Rhodococcus sp. 3258]MDR6934553.1 hypothetical protein [Rhodococcus fascians]
MDIVNSWHLVETLVPEQMTVISTGGKVRDWTKIDRLSPGPEFDLHGFLELTRSSCAEQDVIFKGRRREARIRAVPVLGPSGETHGIQVWVGDREVEPDPVRTVSGIAWLLERTVIEQTVEASMMSGVSAADHVPERTPAEYNAKAVKFDGSEELFAQALVPTHGQKWEGPMSVLHADGRIMRWHCWGRGRTDPPNVGLRLLWHDVTDTTEPDKPTLAELGMPSGLESGGTRIAVFDGRTGILTMWLPEAPTWVKWRDLTSGCGVLHDDDRTTLSDALEKWTHDTAPVSADVRIRAIDDGDVAGWKWQQTRLELRPYPGQLGDRLVLAVLPALQPSDQPLEVPTP